MIADEDVEVECIVLPMVSKVFQCFEGRCRGPKEDVEVGAKVSSRNARIYKGLRLFACGVSRPGAKVSRRKPTECLILLRGFNDLLCADCPPQPLVFLRVFIGFAAATSTSSKWITNFHCF